ncbi:MAG TPA: hypothetical protein VHR18_11830 [Solirubrobacterales bacterium]|jgi:hypothetical protein|nr:hypothetical protein [Solirubrobacterales bacterium]
MGVALALALLLALASEARANKFSVAQCGWFVGADADWADTSGAAKFRPDAFCVPAPGADPFEGAHVKSFTREGETTVSGNRFARWRWTAPPGAWITQVRGTWWHALHDGIEQRVGAVDFAGGFSPFLAAAATDVAPREFATGLASPVLALEDRLLCARAESKWCSLASPSWSSLRALTITLEDPSVPAPSVGGDLLAPGWLRGTRLLAVSGVDGGSGIRFAETLIDSARGALTEFPCAIARIGSEWRGTRMLPCSLVVTGTQAIATNAYSDGPHAFGHCQLDFSGNLGCVGGRTLFFDNTAPAHPRSVAIAGGDGWHRENEFALGWVNPAQAPASPIAGAGWRLTGPNGFDSGVQFAAGRERAALADLRVPGPGAYSLALWLRDEAGNEAPGSALGVPLRFDDLAPTLAFAPGADSVLPTQLVAAVADAHAGPAAGAISYRRAESERWLELPTKLAAIAPGAAELRAPTPGLGPGTYLFRAEALDAAGNAASTTLRGDGTRMAVRVEAPAQVAGVKTRLFARLRGGHGRGESLTVPFAAPALLSGRLTRADGAGVAGRELRIVARPSRGALAERFATTIRTGERGGFELRLEPGPSRRVTIAFAGAPGLEPSRRAPLALRVRAGVGLRAARTRLRNGETLWLSGFVRSRGAAIPRRGKLVAIQYLEQASGRWRPVLVTRSDHDGRFQARYRFRYVSGGARVRLRATVLAEERWPYAPGSSRPVTVDVTAR